MPLRTIVAPSSYCSHTQMSSHPRWQPYPTGKQSIIETEGSSKTIINKTRKRPTPSSSADPKIVYKDHSKNVVYATTLQEHQKHLQNRGLALNIHQAMVLRLRYIAEHVIRSLNEFGWAVVDNFLGSDHYKYTAKEIEKLYGRGLFSPGQLMEGKIKMNFTSKTFDQIIFTGTMDAMEEQKMLQLFVY
uniref:WIYLD domain-containing protein n=1 Tax=Caenorhabditis tropicalis TaxID=1561998 RepID=A0A1I7U6Z5_9PELO